MFVTKAAEFTDFMGFYILRFIQRMCDKERIKHVGDSYGYVASMIFIKGSRNTC